MDRSVHHQPWEFRNLIRADPPLLWVVLMGTLLFFAYSVAFPVYQAPDEPQHVDMVFSIAEFEGWPWKATGRKVAPYVQDSQSLVNRHDFHRDPRGAEEAIPRNERPGFDELRQEPPTQGYNHLGNHPPLYYTSIAVWTSALIGLLLPLSDPSFDVVVSIMRLGSGLLLVLVPVFAYHTARRLDLDGPVAISAAILALGVPQLAHLGGAVNNDALLIMLMSLLMLLLVWAATGDTANRTAIWIGVAAGLAMLTKAFGLIALVMIPFAYLVAHAKGHMDRATALKRTFAALTVSVLAGGWWWAKNLALFQDLLPGGIPAGPAPPTFQPSVISWLDAVYGLMVVGFWGRFGNLNLGLPTPVVLAASVLAGGLLIAGVVASVRDRRSRFDPGISLLLFSPVLLLAIPVLFRGWMEYVEIGRLRGSQGRYLFSGMVGLAVLAAKGGEMLTRRYRLVRWMPLSCLLAVTLMHVIALYSALVTYWGKDTANSVGAAIRGLVAWSPWSVGVVIALAVALVGSTLRLAWGLAHLKHGPEYLPR